MVDTKTVSFMRSLCMGQIEEDVILPFPSIPSAEKETLQGVVSSLEQLMKPHEADFREDSESYQPETVNPRTTTAAAVAVARLTATPEHLRLRRCV